MRNGVKTGGLMAAVALAGLLASGCGAIKVSVAHTSPGELIGAGVAEGSATATDKQSGQEIGGVRIWANVPALTARVLAWAGSLLGQGEQAASAAVAPQGTE